MSPSVCTCRSGPVGDVDLPSGLLCSMLCQGSCVSAGPLGFHIPRKRIMGVWSLLRVCRSVCDYTRALDVPGAGCPRGGSTPPPGVVESALLLARDVQSAVPCLRSSVLLHASRRRLQCAVCCFRWIGEWGVSVPVIGITVFCGASPASPSASPPASPPARARQRATTRLETDRLCKRLII